MGLPNVGKSTLFNALSNAGAKSANFPFCTIEPNVGVVPVPDPRLEVLARIYQSKEAIPASLEIVDIAGLVRGASKGEGLGNQFLAHIREVDAIIHVLRCFDDDNIVHVDGSVDPVRDMEIVNVELALRDLDTVQSRLDRASREAKGTGKLAVAAKRELRVHQKLFAHLSAGEAVWTLDLDAAEREVVQPLRLLTDKSVLFVANVAEGDLEDPSQNPHFRAVYQAAAHPQVIPISAAIEAEISALPAEERAEYLESVGLDEPGLPKVIRAAYELLGLITYLTAGPKESRAWTVRKGALAPEAAGVIHTDFERGFIRAEVIAYDDIVALGGEAAVRQAGKLRVEGKDYVVTEGDIIHFRFNV